MDNLVSICIPVYNGEKYLEECLKSAVEQSYRNFEVLVIDDGSNDSSVEIVRRLQLKDKRIRLIINENNKGLVGNWEECIKNANGEWVKFLFQDDIMHPDCVKKMLTACLYNNLPLCLCSREYLIEPSAPFHISNYVLNYLFRLEMVYPVGTKISPDEIVKYAKDRLFMNFLGEPIAMLFNKNILKSLGTYNRDLVQLVDYEFSLRLCLNSDFYFLPEKLVMFRVHSSSESSRQGSSDIKIIKNKFIEPLVLYHEYLFNPHFTILRKKYGVIKLLREAILFYFHNSRRYKVPSELEKHILSKYRGISLFKITSNYFVLKTKIRNFVTFSIV